MTPWMAARQASLSITNSRSLLKLEPIQLVKPSHHLILCGPLLLLPSVFPRITVFSNDSVLRIRWPKYWSFSFSISPSNEYSGPRGQLGLFLWPPRTSRNQSERQSLTAEPSAPHLSPDTGQKQAIQAGHQWRGDCAPGWAEMLQTRPEPREPEEPGERRRGKRSLSTLLATWEPEASGAYWIPWRPWGIHVRPSRQPRLPRTLTYQRKGAGSGKEEAASEPEAPALVGCAEGPVGALRCACPSPHTRGTCPGPTCHTGAPTVGTRGARTSERWPQSELAQENKEKTPTNTAPHTQNAGFPAPFSPPCPNRGRSCSQRRKGVFWEGSHVSPLPGVSLTWVPSASRPAGTWGSEGCARGIFNFISNYPGLLTNKLPDRWWHLPRCQ